MYILNKILCLILFSLPLPGNIQCLIPIMSANRESVNFLQLTDIGQFGLLRSARENIPAHYHTGIDIMRPSNGFGYEPVFPIADGVIISIRDDGPFAQVIVFHEYNKLQFWTVYEHVAGIKVNLHDRVSPTEPLARFMKREELDTYGWQFNHFHLEILKYPPIKIEGNISNPDRLYSTYSINCYTLEDLYKHYYNPIEFLSDNLRYK